MADKPIINKDGLFNLNSKSASTSNGTSTSFKIKRKNLKKARTNVGWRLNTDTYDKIVELAFDSRMGINEFVQELLDKALSDIDIE